MNILVTIQEGERRNDFLPPDVLCKLKSAGTVKMNEYGRPMREDEFIEKLYDVDICFALSWVQCPPFTKKILDKAKNLKLIVSPGASISGFITDAVYEKGIKVCSANSIMAKYVAEGTLAYMLTALRNIPCHNNEMHNGIWRYKESGTLFGKTIGLVGLGTVGLNLLELLKPFGVNIILFDPYVKKEKLVHYTNVKFASLAEVMTNADIVSVHASKTEETVHMINKENLKLMKDGAILINTARGALIDEKALVNELGSGRITAVLDVYETEPLSAENPLKKLQNIILMPHMAGIVSLKNYSIAMIDEIKRFSKNQTLEYEIPYGQFKLMTQQ